MALFTPTNQKRLTNVSVVKLLIKTDKKRYRFEIACYPNKVVAWRQKLESQINEVLQSELVYTNVSKAEIASKDSLKDAFKTTNVLDICKIILEKGELQLTEKERQVHMDNLYKDVAKIVASKTLNPNTRICFPTGVIEKMIKDCHINLKPNKSAKQQSLEVIRLLKKKSDVQIDMALFSAIIVVQQKQIKSIKRDLLNFCESIVNETTQPDHDLRIEAIFEPGNYEMFKENHLSKCVTIELAQILDVAGDCKQLTDGSSKPVSDDEQEDDAKEDTAVRIHKTQSLEYDSEKEKIGEDNENEDKISSRGSRRSKKNKEYSSSVKDDSEEDTKIDGKEKIMTKKSRRRAKVKGVVGDEANHDVVDSKPDLASSDEEDDNNKSRRRGKKRGNRK